MGSLTRGLGLGMTTVAVGVVVVVAFLWAGPGGAAFSPASASVLFDEDAVVSIYSRVSPAVVEVNTSLGSGPRETLNKTGWLWHSMAGTAGAGRSEK